MGMTKGGRTHASAMKKKKKTSKTERLVQQRMEGLTQHPLEDVEERQWKRCQEQMTQWLEQGMLRGKRCLSHG